MGVTCVCTCKPAILGLKIIYNQSSIVHRKEGCSCLKRNYSEWRGYSVDISTPHLHDGDCNIKSKNRLETVNSEPEISKMSFVCMNTRGHTSYAVPRLFNQRELSSRNSGITDLPLYYNYILCECISPFFHIIKFSKTTQMTENVEKRELSKVTKVVGQIQKGILCCFHAVVLLGA